MVRSKAEDFPGAVFIAATDAWYDLKHVPHPESSALSCSLQHAEIAISRRIPAATEAFGRSTPTGQKLPNPLTKGYTLKYNPLTKECTLKYNRKAIHSFCPEALGG